MGGLGRGVLDEEDEIASVCDVSAGGGKVSWRKKMNIF